MRIYSLPSDSNLLPQNASRVSLRDVEEVAQPLKRQIASSKIVLMRIASLGARKCAKTKASNPLEVSQNPISSARPNSFTLRDAAAGAWERFLRERRGLKSFDDR